MSFFFKAFCSRKLSGNLPKLCCSTSEKENGRINVNILWGKHEENPVCWKNLYLTWHQDADKYENIVCKYTRKHRDTGWELTLILRTVCSSAHRDKEENLLTEKYLKNTIYDDYILKVLLFPFDNTETFSTRLPSFRRHWLP